MTQKTKNLKGNYTGSSNLMETVAVQGGIKDIGNYPRIISFGHDEDNNTFKPCHENSDPSRKSIQLKKSQ